MKFLHRFTPRVIWAILTILGFVLGLLAYSLAASAPSDKSPVFTKVSDSHLGTYPPSGSPPGFYQWCNTLRGKGAVSLALDDVTFIVVIDCPSDIKKDM